MDVSTQRRVHVTVAGIKGKWRMDHANVRNVGGVEFAVILTRDRTLTTLLALLAEHTAEIIGKKNIKFWCFGFGRPAVTSSQRAPRNASARC